jgi:hypothetical protein
MKYSWIILFAARRRLLLPKNYIAAVQMIANKKIIYRKLKNNFLYICYDNEAEL